MADQSAQPVLGFVISAGADLSSRADSLRAPGAPRRLEGRRVAPCLGGRRAPARRRLLLPQPRLQGPQPWPLRRAEVLPMLDGILQQYTEASPTIASTCNKDLSEQHHRELAVAAFLRLTNVLRSHLERDIH